MAAGAGADGITSSGFKVRNTTLMTNDWPGDDKGRRNSSTVVEVVDEELDLGRVKVIVTQKKCGEGGDVESEASKVFGLPVGVVVEFSSGVDRSDSA